MDADEWAPPDSDAEPEDAQFSNMPQPSVVGKMDTDEWASLESDVESEDAEHSNMPRPSVGGLPQAPVSVGLPQQLDIGRKKTIVKLEPKKLPRHKKTDGAVAVNRGTGKGTGKGRGLAARLLQRPQRKKGPALEAAPSMKGKQRQLKRRVSESRPEDVSVVTMVCVWGGDIKNPFVVQPVWKELGKTWMSPNEHCLWLRRACCPRGMTHYKELFQSAISALRREIQAAFLQVSNPDPARQLRAALALDSDDDDDGGGGPRKKVACPPRPRKKTVGDAASTLEVSLGDSKITIQSKMRPLRIEVTEAAVTGIIEWCRQHVREGKPILKKHAHEHAKKSGGSFVMPADGCPGIVGKVTWQPSHTAWCVHGKNDKGVHFTTRVKVGGGRNKAGFLQAASQAVGLPHMNAKDTFNMQRRKSYIEALELWNAEDKSTRPRIIVPAD